VIQALEDGALWGLLLLAEKKWRGARRPGVLTGAALVVWGLVRSLDEKLLLGQESHSGSVGVQVAGLVLAAMGLAVLVRVVVGRQSVPSPSDHVGSS
jgi:hypothetical protein